MKVAVYSGSFNPLHVGHMTVIRHLLTHGGFDMVYLVVTPQNPFKDGSLAASADGRLDAARSAVQRSGLSDRVKVDDIEYTMPYPSYTIRTLDALKAREPRNRFTLVVGGDNLGQLLLWKEGERILEQYGVVVYPREGFNIVHEAASMRLKHRNGERLFSPGAPHRPYKIKLLKDAPLVNVSSSEIRRRISEGEDVSGLLA